MFDEDCSTRLARQRIAGLYNQTYGRVYGMKKTTVYLTDDLKAALERAAVAQGRSEAELIRDAVRDLTQGLEPPRPRLPLFSSGDPTLAERVDEELARGFGR